MLTPALEKLILCGKASFNTFVAGGSEKSVLFVDNDRFIIITGFTYFPMINGKAINLSVLELTAILKRNTQMKVFSDKSNNVFQFRNELNISQIRNNDISQNQLFTVTPGAPVKMETYLIHDSSVAFTFSYSMGLVDLNRDLSPPESVGFPIPMDYGKRGQNGIPVRNAAETTDTVTAQKIYMGGKFVNNGIGSGVNEFIYPIDANTAINPTLLNSAENYPLVNVQYVEILGNPTNIAATL
jgi:hypothetical protein